MKVGNNVYLIQRLQQGTWTSKRSLSKVKKPAKSAKKPIPNPIFASIESRVNFCHNLKINAILYPYAFNTQLCKILFGKMLGLGEKLLAKPIPTSLHQFYVWTRLGVKTVSLKLPVASIMKKTIVKFKFI